MLNLINNIISYNLFKKFGFPKVLPSILTLNVNNWCNSKCKTCNIWMNNPVEKIKEELALKEFQKIFAHYGKTYWITVTGGEPFLRKDLTDIIKTVYEKTGPKLMTITTNGTIPEKIASLTSQILGSCKKLNLIVNVSLDGIGKQHDGIRGFKGNYERVVQTVNGLKALNQDRLTVGINSIISVFNVSDFLKIYKHITEDLKPDSYIAEIAENRAKLSNMKLKITPETNDYQKVLLFLIDSLKRENREKSVPEIVRILRIEFYRYLMKAYTLKNFEGIASAYIMHNGDISVSDSRPYVIGNLREVDYDFKKLWFNENAENFRKTMDNEYSTLAVNAFYTNFICNPKNVLGLVLSS